MNNKLLKAANERFPNLTAAEERMLCAVKSVRAICGSDDDDSNLANNPQCGELWDKTRTIHADVIEWLCKNAATHDRSASDGIHVYGAKVEGILDLSYANIHLPFWFERCCFKEEIWLKNAKIPSLNLIGCWTRRILADGLQVANNVGFRDGFRSTGEVLFRDANIGGGFMAVGATFEYEPSEMSRTNSINSLGCDRMAVNGSMFLHRSSFKGEVGLAGAFIGSNLECDGSSFENPFSTPDGHRYAIRADRITVNGGVFLRPLMVSGEQGGQWRQFSAKGAVRFINASMGVLDCTTAVIEGDGESGFCAEGATISDKAVFDGFTVRNGGIELRAITAGDVTFRGSKLTTVDLRFATIRRALRVKQIQDAAHSLWALQNASVGSLDDDEESWPPQGRLFIDGFKYQGFGSPSFDRPSESPQAPLDFRLRKQWIELDNFRPPYAYRQLANAYLKMGDTLKARQALYALEELLHLTMIQESGNSFVRALRRGWRHLLKWTIGYGYRLGLAGWWLGLFLAVGFVLSYWGYCADLMVPTDKDAYAFFAQQQHWYPPNGYTIFHASMFTIENSLPAINLSMSDHWRAVGCLSWWFFVQRIVGWLLSIFFVAGITGLAKSEK
jgi:hypothetical protein